MVAIFKRQARVGVSQSSIINVSEVVDELVEHYVLLISLTDFLEVRFFGHCLSGTKLINLQYEEQQDTQKPQRKGFL